MVVRTGLNEFHCSDFLTLLYIRSRFYIPSKIPTASFQPRIISKKLKFKICDRILGPNRFTVEITGANLEVSYHDKFGCAFIRSNSSLDHVGVQGKITQIFFSINSRIHKRQRSFYSLTPVLTSVENMISIKLSTTEFHSNRFVFNSFIFWVFSLF